MKIYFLSYEENVPQYELWVQTLLTIAAALLGAFVAHMFHERSEAKRREESRRSRAVSAIKKVSRAFNMLLGLRETFFEHVTPDMNKRDYWRVVLPTGKQTVKLDQLTDAEFELLMQADPSGSLATDTLQLLDLAIIELDALAFYSEVRRELSIQLDPFIRQIDEANEGIAYQYDPNAHRGLHRNVLEISSLCTQNYDGLASTIEKATLLVGEIN